MIDITFLPNRGSIQVHRRKGGVLNILNILDILSIWAGACMLYDKLCGLDFDWTMWRLYLFSFIVLFVRTENTSFNYELRV
jgi:hypothetical protein